MITILTDDNFSEVLSAETRPSLVKFHTEAGCQPCLDFAPAFEAFADSHPNIACFSLSKPKLSDPSGKVMMTYGISSFPTLASFDKGKIANSAPATSRQGFISFADMENMTKTLRNISDYELYIAIVDARIGIATIQKSLYQAQMSEVALNTEKANRLNPKSGVPYVPKPVAQEMPDIIDPADEVVCDGCQ